MGAVAKEKFLTDRWNNWLTLGLGLPTLLYMIYAYATPLWASKEGLIIIGVIGAIY